MDFNKEYSKIKNLVKDELSIIENNMVKMIEVREPLSTSLKTFLTLPSKRIRPVLGALYIKAVDGSLSDTQLAVLTIVELVHNASLIHDDIIDNSNLRRGHKTLSVEFDNKLAVISGDYLLALAMEKLTEINNFDVIRQFSQSIKQMCIGEINQNFDRFKVGSIEDYIEKTRNKTAYLFETTFICGALLGDVSSYELQQVKEFGTNVGIAFQIRDDIINMINEDFSKPVYNDIENGIYNAPVILGDRGDNYLSGIEKTKVLLNNYVKNAYANISNLPNNEYRLALEEFLELLKNV